MPARSPAHPAKEQLAAFGLGRLEHAHVAWVERHLEYCPECCAELNELATDELVTALRTVARGLADADEAALTIAETTPSEAAASIPCELEGHPRYRVLRLLGRGGMGAVYCAEHTLMERLVALKVIEPRLLSRPGARARFRQEVRAAARLSHPNIVAAYDAEQAGALTFLVMEYVEGRSLADVLRERGPLPVALACDYVRQAALGLQHAHERGMVHRDIKPHNLMLTPDGQVKVLDFGLARLACEPLAKATNDAESRSVAAPGTLTQTGIVMGTLDYIAPEQARDPHTADGRADTYSLGCTLYQLLTGQVPFPNGTPAEKLARLDSVEPPRVDAGRRDVPPDVAAVVGRMLSKRPDGRFTTPAEVAEALAPFVGRGKARHRSIARTAPALTAVLVLSIVLVSAAWWWQSRGDGARVVGQGPDVNPPARVPPPPTTEPAGAIDPAPILPDVPALLDELARRTPVIDDDFSDTRKSPFAGALAHAAFGWKPGVLSLRYGSDAPGPGWANWIVTQLKPAPLACRIIGRTLGGTGDCWVLPLALESRESPIHIELAADGELRIKAGSGYPEGSRAGFPKCFRCPKFNVGDWNTMLVVLTGDFLIIHVNDVSVCEPILLAPELPRARLGIAFFSTDRARSPGVEFKRFTTWDLGPRNPPAPSDVLDFREVHGADIDSLKAWSDKLPPWYRIATISACAGASDPAFNAIAIRDQRRVAFNLHFQGLVTDMKQFAAMHTADYRLQTSCLYRFAAQAGEAYVWVKDGQHWSGWGGPKADIVKRLEEGKATGARPSSFSAALRTDGLYCSVCFAPANGVAWDFRFDLSIEGLRQWLAERAKENWRPELLSGYHDGKQLGFMAVMVEGRDTLDWGFDIDLLPAEYEKALVDNRERGRRPHSVVSYLAEGEIRYAVIWLRYLPPPTDIAGN